MIRTQIQLPDSLYERAKQFADASELSLAEVTRRGIELYLDRYPAPSSQKVHWQVPVVRVGKPTVALDALRGVLAEQETRLPKR
jgi:hypothetical protein